MYNCSSYALLCQVVLVHFTFLLDVLQDRPQHPDDGDDERAEGDGPEMEHGGIVHRGAQGAAWQVILLVQGPVPLKCEGNIRNITK